MSRKKSGKQIMKAFNGVMNDVSVGKGQKQKIRIIDRVPLEQDEFTEHRELKTILSKFVMEAHDAQSHYQTRIKQMVREVALRLEDKLLEMGKPEFICHICEELIRILKQHKIRWHPVYIRRCLEEKYKDPTHRAVALAGAEARKKENIGVPIDSGRTVEELEQALNRKNNEEGYSVSTQLNILHEFDAVGTPSQIKKRLEDWKKEFVGKIMKYDVDKENELIRFIMNIPVRVDVDVKGRKAVVTMDKDAYDILAIGNQIERKSAGASKPNNKKRIAEIRKGEDETNSSLQGMLSAAKVLFSDEQNKNK